MNQSYGEYKGLTPKEKVIILTDESDDGEMEKTKITREFVE